MLRHLRKVGSLKYRPEAQRLVPECRRASSSLKARHYLLVGVKHYSLLAIFGNNAGRKTMTAYKNDHIRLNEVAAVVTLPMFDAKTSISIRSQPCTVRTVRTPFTTWNTQGMSLCRPTSIRDLDEVDALKLHDHTSSTTSDPLTQFAVVLSALMHDVDRPGGIQLHT